MRGLRLTGVFGEKVSLGQANGPDVELIVRGTEMYATYETPDGFPVVYDDARGVFCFARVVDGQFESTGISVASPPPAGMERHAAESDLVRARKIEARTREMNQRAPTNDSEED